MNTMETQVEATKSPLNRALRREKAKTNGSKIQGGLQEPYINYEKKIQFGITNKVVREQWSLSKLKDDFDPTNSQSVINDKPKFQRPDVDGSSLSHLPANAWQQKLVGDFLMEGNLQPIYLRKLEDGTYEIVDGGHRSRSFWKFFKGWLHLPEGVIIKDNNGVEYDLSGMNWKNIVSKYGSDFAQSILDSFKLDIRIYSNISDKEAELLFIKLNNLNKMERADFRNAKHHIIADVVRKYGSIDSPDAFEVLRIEDQQKPLKLKYVALSRTKRVTDTLVAFSLEYLWKGGLSNTKYKGMDSENGIDIMYDVKNTNNPETSLLIARLENPNDPLISNLKDLWGIINDVIKEGTLSTNLKWNSGVIKKLVMLVCESAWANGGFENYKPNSKELFNQLKTAYHSITTSKDTLRHNPHQFYDLIDGEVKVRTTQPKKVSDDSYPFASVFKGGARVDDLEYILLYFKSKGLFEFGLTNSKDSSRVFSEKQGDEIKSNSQYKCKCGADLHNTKSVLDHILAYAYGGPTDVRNGQALCTPCNKNKSSGMTLDDVELLCKNYGYSNFQSLKEFTIAGTVLTEEEIRKVKKIVIDGVK
jgi:hypothetical protein